jgi:hypothetical protein
MSPMLILLSTLALGQTAELKTFTSEEAGVRLRYPAAWKSVRADSPDTLLLLALESDGFSPEIVVMLKRLKNPTPVAEYRAQLEKWVTDHYKEAKVAGGGDLTVFNRKGCQVEFEIKSPDGKTELLLVKSGISLGLRRYLIVDCALPKDKAAELRRVFDQILSTVEFFPPREADAVSRGAEKFEELRKKMFASPARIDRRETLEVLLAEGPGADKPLGTYAYTFKNARVADRDGFSAQTEIRLDLQNGQKSEIDSESFVSTDLSYQTVKIREKSIVENAKTYEYEGSATMERGKVSATRAINGVRSQTTFDVPDGTVFVDLLEWLQWRIQEFPEVEAHVRTLSVYDDHVDFVKIEGSTSGRDRPEAAYYVILTRPDGTFLTYTYSRERTVSVLRGRNWKGLIQPIWMRAKQN